MADSIRDRDWPALRNSQDGKRSQTQGIDNGFEVADECFEREIFNVPMRKSVASFVISHQQMVAPKLFQDMTPDWTLPVELEMVKPVGRLDQRGTLAGGGVANSHAISGDTKMNLLFDAHQTNTSPMPPSPSFERIS